MQNTKMSGRLGKLTELAKNMESLDDYSERVSILLEYADRFQEVPEWIAKRPFPEKHQVPFCESEAYVWLRERSDQSVKLYFAVENPAGLSAKALAVCLDENLSGLTAEEISQVSPEIVYQIFGPNLSMGKGQGLVGMLAMVKSEANKIKQGAGRKVEMSTATS